jgi:hypothetical protein
MNDSLPAGCIFLWHLWRLGKEIMGKGARHYPNELTDPQAVSKPYPTLSSGLSCTSLGFDAPGKNLNCTRSFGMKPGASEVDTALFDSVETAKWIVL